MQNKYQYHSDEDHTSAPGRPRDRDGRRRGRGERRGRKGGRKRQRQQQQQQQQEGTVQTWPVEGINISVRGRKREEEMLIRYLSLLFIPDGDIAPPARRASHGGLRHNRAVPLRGDGEGPSAASASCVGRGEEGAAPGAGPAAAGIRHEGTGQEAHRNRATFPPAGHHRRRPSPRVPRGGPAQPHLRLCPLQSALAAGVVAKQETGAIALQLPIYEEFLGLFK